MGTECSPELTGTQAKAGAESAFRKQAARKPDLFTPGGQTAKPAGPVGLPSGGGAVQPFRVGREEEIGYTGRRKAAVTQSQGREPAGPLQQGER